MKTSFSEFERAQELRNHNRLRTQTQYIQFEAVKRYNAKIKERGSTWIKLSVPDKYFVSRLMKELGEFFENPSSEEAADILNFLAMIVERHNLS